MPDKLEGLAIGADGMAYLVTDNDGVDENYGETVFLVADASDVQRGPSGSIRRRGT